MVLEQLDVNMQKNESRHRSYILHKNELRIDQRPKCKMQYIKLLEDNIDNLDDLEFAEDFLGIRGRQQSMKEGIDKLNLIYF